LTEKGKILEQPEDLKTANLINVHNAGYYYIEPSIRAWKDESLPIKKGDPRRPIIPIAIGTHIFQEAVCDFGASVNIMPKVIYDKINGDTLLYTNMHLQLTNQSLHYPKGILEDICVRVGSLYIPVDSVVLETCGDVRVPIILG
jgi:hypothetical protein